MYVYKYAYTQAWRLTSWYTTSHMKACYFHMIQCLLAFLMTKRVSSYAPQLTNPNKGFSFNLLFEYIWFLILLLDVLNLEFLSCVLPEKCYFTAIYLGVGFKTLLLATTIVALLSSYTIDSEEKLRFSLSKPNVSNTSFKNPWSEISHLVHVKVPHIRHVEWMIITQSSIRKPRLEDILKAL